MGTSLQVQPFAGLVREVGSDVPRLLINRERAGEDTGGASLFASVAGRLGLTPGFRFDEANMCDVFYQGDCDRGVWELVRFLGWEADFKMFLSGGTGDRQPV